MSFIQQVEEWFEEDEAEVVKIFIAIRNGAEVTLTDLNAAAKWIAAQTPSIASDIQGAVAIATEVGAISNPEVAAAVAAANASVVALNAFASAENAGQNTAQSVAAGYVAVKQAQATSASASAAAVAAGK